jgi:drug/metabolite transporter (DMT)-like permease
MYNVSPVKALWIAVFVTGLYPVAGKFAVGLISPSLLLIISTFTAVVWYGPWLTKNKLWRRFFDKDTFLPFCMVGFMGTALPFLCIFIALRYTTPANSAILNQAEAVYSLILTAVFLRERPAAKQLLGTALILAGVVIILFNGNFAVRWKGDIIVLCTVWMFQVSHIFAKKLPKDLEPRLISAGRALFACVFSVPIAVVLSFFSPDVWVFAPDAKTWGLLFYMGFINYAFGNAMWYTAIRNMDLSKATAVVLCYPVVTYLVSVLTGLDVLDIRQTAGLTLALSGAYLVTHIIKKGRKERNEISVI